MNRILLSALVGIALILNLLISDAAQAFPLRPILLTDISESAPESFKDVISHLESEVLPKLDNILYPEQRERFKSAIVDGSSFRKAFKSLSLSPDQKFELGNLFRTLPKRDLLASLTVEQKKQLFMKKREMFAPSAADIKEKIDDGIKMKGKSLPQGVGEKISEKLKFAEEKTSGAMEKAAGLILSTKKISEKIEATMKQVGTQ